MSISGERAYSFLNELSFVRCAGGTGEETAVKKIMDIVATAGLSCSTESFPINLGCSKACFLESIFPFKKQYAAVSYNATSDSEDEAELVFVDKLTDDMCAGLKGKAVFATKVELARTLSETSGIKALICLEGDCHLWVQAAQGSPQEKPVPVFSMSLSDSLELFNSGIKKIRYPSATSVKKSNCKNIIIDIPGEERTAGTILIGAHYDSVADGVGASDNAGGAAAVIELALHNAKRKHKHNLRFVWFGAEEAGLCGSRAYIAAHEREICDFKLMINLDVVGSTFGQNFVLAALDADAIKQLQGLADDTGYEVAVREGLMGSDSTTFAARGIPSIGMGRSAAQCMQYCHTRLDRPEYCSPELIYKTADYANRVIDFMDQLLMEKELLVPEKVIKNAEEQMNKY